MLFLTGVVRQEESRPSFDWNMDRTRFILKGHEFTMAKFPLLYTNSRDAASKALDQFGFSTLLPSQLVIEDSLVNTNLNYGFLEGGGKQLRSCSSRGLKYVMEGPGRARFLLAYDAETGTPTWSFPAIEKFMGIAQEVMENLLILMHITGGQPVRGPEIMSASFRNVRNVHRSVFIHKGALTTMYGYDKVNHSLLNSCHQWL